MLASLGLSIAAHRDAVRQADLLLHTARSHSALDGLLLGIADARLAARDLEGADDSRAAALRARAADRALRELGRVESLAAAHPEQQARLPALRRLAQRALAQTSFPSDSLRVVVATMRADEAWRREERGEALDRAQARAAVLAGAAGLMLVALIAMAAAFMRRLDAAGRRARLELDRFFDLADDPMCVATAEGPLLRFNSAFQRLLGWSEEELRGRPALELVHPDDRPRAAAYARLSRRAGGHRDILVRLLTRDGGARSVLWSVSETSPDGILYAVGRDQAERQAALRRQQELRAALEAQRAEAQDVISELETLSYSVSHLRAPLRQVSEDAERLSQGAAGRLTEDESRQLSQISRVAARMGACLDDLACLSRIARAPLRDGPVALETVVAEARADVVAAAADRVIRWEIAALPKVRGDAALLRQAFANLLANAVTYTRGRADAAIRVSAQPEAFGMVLVTVADNGVGFEAHDADKLFGLPQRLYREDTAGGTGMGLAIVQRIVEKHGGRVWAEGARDLGASFFLALPAYGPDNGRHAAGDRVAPRPQPG